MWFLSRKKDDNQSKSDEPALLDIRSSTWFIVITVCVAAFSDAFIYGVVIPVFPYTLQSRFGVPDEDVQFWNSALLTAFGAAQFIFSPLFGHLADGSQTRRSPLLLGFLGNAAATALLYLARNVWVLVLSRFLQGLSAAVVYTVGFALVADTVGQGNIGQWMGFIISSLNVGMMISPSLGGILYDRLGYESIFIAVFVLIAIDVFLRIVMIEKKVAVKYRERESLISNDDTPQYGSIPPPKQKNAAGYIVESTSRDRQLSSSPEPPLLLTPQPNLTATKHPLLTLLSSPRILTSLYGSLVTVVVLVAFDAALPIFVAQQFGWSSTGGGLIFLTITLPIFAAPLAGRIADRYPNSWLVALWFVLSGALTAGLYAVTIDGLGPMVQKVLLGSLLTLYGFARTFGSSPLSADLSRAVAAMEKANPGVFGGKDATAQVYSLYTSASAAGVLVGPVWADLVFGRHGWTTLVVSLGLLSASVGVLVMLFKPGRIEKKEVGEVDA